MEANPTTGNSTNIDEMNSQIVLYDGICNLCNSAVLFILKNERSAKIRFASLQSDYARKLKKRFNIPEDYTDSFVFIENGQAYFRSSAVLRVSNYLKGIYSTGKFFLILPSFIRDPLYNFIAKYRYKWFGKKDKCWLPSQEIKARFLDI